MTNASDSTRSERDSWAAGASQSKRWDSVIDLAPRARAGELSGESVIQQPLRQALRSPTKDDDGRRRRRRDGAPEVSPEAGVGRDLVAAFAGPDPKPTSATSRDWPSASPFAPRRRFGRRLT